jgi:hypothetical protein
MDTRSEISDFDTEDVNNQLYEALRIRGVFLYLFYDTCRNWNLGHFILQVTSV